MTLLEALREFLTSYYSGDIRYEDSSGLDRCMVLREIGIHRNEPTRFKIFPIVNIFLRGGQNERQMVETTMENIWRALDVVKPLYLTPTYKASHSEAEGRPISLGQDEAGNWSRTLNINFSIPTNQTI